MAALALSPCGRRAPMMRADGDDLQSAARAARHDHPKSCTLSLGASPPMGAMSAHPATLYDKLVDAHTVRCIGDRRVLLYVDRHIINEYTSPQAFAALRDSARPAARPEAAFAIVDHVNPTAARRSQH